MQICINIACLSRGLHSSSNSVKAKARMLSLLSCVQQGERRESRLFAKCKVLYTIQCHYNKWIKWYNLIDKQKHWVKRSRTICNSLMKYEQKKIRNGTRHEMASMYQKALRSSTWLGLLLVTSATNFTSHQHLIKHADYGLGVARLQCYIFQLCASIASVFRFYPIIT